MNISIPIYVQELTSKGEAAPVFTVRPLFFPDYEEERDEILKRAINKLARSLKRSLDRLGRAERHDLLAQYTFHPDMEDHFFNFSIGLRQRRVDCNMLIVTFEDLGRKLAFSPSLPDLWFEIARGETLYDRAVEVLTRHFRDLEKENAANWNKPGELSIQGKAWVIPLEIDIHPQQEPDKKESSAFASLGGSEVLDGDKELHNVGRCLDWLYPDELDRVICRDGEVAELTRLLTASDRRPVLITGPRMVGKTALVHEFVYRAVEKRQSIYSSKNNVWLLSPQRLISGMSFVGQWENRLLAILKEAEKKSHILYFDDLLGLFHAGVSRDSKLCALDVMKPYVEKRRFRLLAEITSEAFHILQEKDRGFADMFQILPVKETNEDETIRILISLIRNLERQHNCKFELDVLPIALDIERRYVRDAVFPGKAASFLRQLAVKFRNSKVSRRDVLGEFQARSGLSITFLDSSVKLDRREVIEAIDKEVIGQNAALHAAADVISVAKARLNDPDRPLAAFLFLGPTGVGKTQCAKSLAKYLFGDAEKILRFDMNEFVSPYSVARLVGTFDNPEGLLTSAVRRQPFSIVLLDEIEKADPDVFNLLLQVMGEGRLTDAMGRTVDFTNTILILTSNLGVKEASGQLGFHHDESSEANVYIHAAEKFFKPEFFNRLDRIVPFARLRREDVRRIAKRLIEDVFSREGLVRRKCMLQLDETAMEKIVDQGYHPLLGARALKRAIERQLTQPIASRLASMSPETPTIVSLYPGQETITVHVQALTRIELKDSVTPHYEIGNPGIALERINRAVDAIEHEASRFQPKGAINTDSVQPEHYLYFTIKEEIRRIRNVCRLAEERISAPKRSSVVLQKFPQQNNRRYPIAKQLSWRNAGVQRQLKEILVAQDIHSSLQDLANNSTVQTDRLEDFIAEAARETALLDTIARSGSEPAVKGVIVYIRSVDESKESQRVLLSGLYEKLFSNQWGLTVAALDDLDESTGRGAEILYVKGAHALPILKTEEGTHLFFPAHDNFVPVQVMTLPIADGEDHRSILEAHIKNRRLWLERFYRGEASVDDDPFRLLPVIRIYDEQGATLDLRTGLIATKMPSIADFRAFILTAIANK